MNEIVNLLDEKGWDKGSIFFMESDNGLVVLGREFKALDERAVAFSLMATLSKMYGLDFLDQLSFNMESIKKQIGDLGVLDNLSPDSKSGVFH
jgi:hypothetical protein